jgi:ATP-dependent Zn protease
VKHPTLEDRKKLFSFYLKNITHDESLDPNRLARMCVGFTPAKIENIIREASLIAYREKCTKTSYQHIHEAYNRIVIGALSREKHNPESLKKTACHESGHAIITYLIHPTAEVFIATIRARGGALGFIDSRDIEELKVNSPSKEHWLAEIQVLLAGYVAERITMGTTASGVGGSPGSDFHRAMHIARYMVESLGMGESGLIGDFTALTSQGLSEKTMEIIEDDTQSILQSCLKVTTETLEKHKDLLKHFTKKLLEKQELFHEDIQDIFDEFNLKAAAQTTMEKNNLEDA